MTVQWQPGVRLNLPRLKAAVLRWRGAVRYAGASVAVTGVLEEAETRGGASGWLLRTGETHQSFRLRAAPGGPDLESLRAGEPARVEGRVIRVGEGKEDEIWLELERAEPGTESPKGG